MLALSVLSLAPAAQAGERADRETLQRRLGNQGVVDLDRQSGTPRVLARLDGTLTRASGRDPEAIASSYVRSNLSVLGLTTADFDVLEPAARSELPGGVTSIQWRQAVDGIPSADHSLRVNVGSDGRVLSVLGAPEHALDARTTTPSLSPGEAVRAVQDDVGAHRPVVRVRGPSGVTRTTSYGDDTSASLVTFSGRLAWRVRYRAGADAVYDATVDASTGDVLRVANMVKNEAPALVWERFPGNSVGGTAATVDLEEPGWLTPSATTLNGPNVHAFSDLDDNDAASANEEVTRTGGGFSFPFASVAGSGCDAAHLCSWSGGTSSDRTGNREQDTVQAFYFANRFHDHLAALGFNAAAGAFQGADALQLNTLDGASGGPDADHVNNANMFTPPDGSPPRMQMYLWRSPSRNISSGSDAAILYHEYTHGLSNRLVTDAEGAGALNSAESGAMGEAWSDWYAQDFIVGQFPGLDTVASGEVVMGEYTDAGASLLRTEPLDCPVGADPVRCPGRPAVGSGGYTYGDFGRIWGGAEVHADGEIWAQTLWDLRTALGTAKARALVTTGMALLPPEPSFLDGRNGILLADQTLYGGSDVGALWSLFAARGMGFFAAAVGGEDTAPAESFALPPAADGPKGTITGRVTNALGGGPLAGVTVGLAGLSTYAATTDADGRYTIAAVPEGTYLKVLAGGSGYDSEVSSLSIVGGVSITYSPVLRRNWASVGGGATIAASNGSEYTQYGCGPNAAVDQSLGTGWSTDSDAEKYLIVRLPSTIDVTQFALDPAESCGDSAVSATAGYRVETSPDGSAWTVARTGTFTSAARHTLNFVAPTAGSSGVRYARLTLLSSQGAGAQYRDLAEFGVYGTSGQPADTVAPNTAIDEGPAGTTRNATPEFTFIADEPGSTFECTVDAGVFAACTSPHTLTALTDGTHTFSVRAIDVAGNTDATPATRTFTVDTTAPETTLAPGGPPFTFTSNEAGSEFECRLDGGAPASCTSPRDLGTLPDGEHTFVVTATDAAGNTDSTPASRTFTVDTLAPETTLNTGPSATTGDNAPVLAFSASEAGATFECKLDGPGPATGAFGTCSSPRSLGTLADGTYTFSARATDAAGNVDLSPASQTFTVDTGAPETTIAPQPADPTNDNTPTFSFSSPKAGSSFECRLDDAVFTACDSPLTLEVVPDGNHTFAVRAISAVGNVDPTPATLSFSVDTVAPDTTIGGGPASFTFASDEARVTFECKLDAGEFEACTSPRPLGSLADGEHTFSVRAIDAAGNKDTAPASSTFTVDTVGPAATILTGPNSYGNDTTPEFSFQSEQGATFRCTLEAQDKPTRDAPCASPLVYESLPDNSYTFSVRATDAAGNEGPPATRTFTIFTTGPQTGIANGPQGLTTDESPVFELRSTLPSATFECKLDAGDFAPCSSTFLAGVLAEGAHTFQARSIDELGNVGPAATRAFTIDTEKPEISVSGPTEAHSGPLAFAVRASDGRIECALDDDAFGSCATLLRADDLAMGEHVYRARSTDSAGNVSDPAELPFTVVNATPVVKLDFDSDRGPAPHTVHTTITATDADGDRLTYTLDFGDGQTVTGALPVGAIEHRYTAAGAYTARLRVTDGRGPVAVERAIAVTTAQAQPQPLSAPLSLALSAPAVDLGTFIPGLARDYSGTLTATTTGPAATLRVSDPSAAARGHLVSPTGALAQPLQVRAAGGAFAPLESAVTIPTTVEFKQSISADETLRPGLYAKALTFTLSVSTP